MDPNDDNEEEKKIKKLVAFNSLLEEELARNNINIIEEQQVKRGEVIGEGAFGKVYKGTYMEIHEVAIKKLLFDVMDKEVDFVLKVAEIVNEINIIKLAKHDNIPVFYGIWRKKKSLNLIFEFIDGPMLKDFYKQTSFNDKLDLLIQLTTIIEFMHSKKLIHRDIKPGNVMVRTKDKMVKLIDFGTSKIAKNTCTHTASPSGTISYIPPEAFHVDLNPSEEREDGKILEITPKYDIWSMGCMISEIYSGVTPWSNKVKGQFGIQNQLIMKKPFPLPKKDLLPEEIIPIIQACTEIEVSVRCSATQLLELLHKINRK
jgi:serine/threonine protein kinase